MAHRTLALAASVSLLLLTAFWPAHTVPLSALADDCANYVVNGSFELGEPDAFDGWQDNDGPWTADHLHHDGAISGVLGGADDADHQLWQTLSVPQGSNPVTLRFWWYVYSLELPEMQHVYDEFWVVVRDSQGVEHEVARLDNHSVRSVWQETVVDLGPTQFPTLQDGAMTLLFRCTTDGSYFTSFYIDDVRIEACGVTPTDTLLASPSATATQTVTVTCGADAYEPNDSYPAAVPISASVGIQALICPSGDVDWYRFDASAGQTITVTLAGVGGDMPADYDLWLYGVDGQEASRSTRGGNAPELIEHAALVSGEYRAYVIGYSGAYHASSAYALEVALAPQGAATQTETPTETATVAATTTPSGTSVTPPATLPPTVAPTEPQPQPRLWLPLLKHLLDG